MQRKNRNNKNMVILDNVFETAEKSTAITVYNDGIKTEYAAGGNEYLKIVSCWNNTVDGAREMPAYGVSLNDCTVAEMSKGIWLEFIYDSRTVVNELYFEKLLIKVEREFGGFNIIRYNGEYGYDGRCFYVDLAGKNMARLYNLLVNL